MCKDINETKMNITSDILNDPLILCLLKIPLYLLNIISFNSQCNVQPILWKSKNYQSASCGWKLLFGNASLDSYFSDFLSKEKMTINIVNRLLLVQAEIFENWADQHKELKNDNFF